MIDDQSVSFSVHHSTSEYFSKKGTSPADVMAHDKLCHSSPAAALAGLTQPAMLPPSGGGACRSSLRTPGPLRNHKQMYSTGHRDTQKHLCLRHPRVLPANSLLPHFPRPPFLKLWRIFLDRVFLPQHHFHSFLAGAVEVAEGNSSRFLYYKTSD